MKQIIILALVIVYPLLYNTLMKELIKPVMTLREEERLMVGNVNVTDIKYIVEECETDRQQPQVKMEKPVEESAHYGYSRRQQAILDRLDSGTKIPFKAIVFKENWEYGIGNMYRSMASVLMLAIVTNRTFYVDSTNYNVFFHPRFPVVRMVDDEVYRLKYSQKWYDESIGDYYLDKEFCGKNLNEYWKEDVIVFNTITDMSHLILDNPEHMAVMRQLGIVKKSDYNFQHFEILQFGFYNLFSNSKGFMDTIDEWRPQFNEHRIGVQFRTGGSNANTHETTSYLSLRDIPQAVSGIRKYCQKKGILMSTVTIHLSTDSNHVINEFRREFGDRLFIPPNHEIIHTSFAKSQARFNGYTTALIDIALLRECEYLLLTKRSSFGWCMGMQMKQWNGGYMHRSQTKVDNVAHLIV